MRQKMPTRNPARQPAPRAGREWRLAAAAWLAAGMAAAAADVSFDVQPRVLAPGETARARVTVQGVDRAPAPALPDVDGFRIRFAGERSQVRIVNREIAREVIFEYLLTAERPGVFEIGPFPYAVGGRQADLPAVRIEVVEDRGPREASGLLSERLFATLDTPRDEPYVQESLPLRLSVYSLPDVPLGPEMRLEGMPSSGFTLTAWEEQGRTREQVDGRIYEVRRFQAQLRPLTAGTLDFAPVLRLNLLVPRQRSRGSFFDDPFFDRFFSGPFPARTGQQPVELEVRPMRLRVRPLPDEGRPDGFAGAVGRFRLEARAQPGEVSVGEPVALRVEISGEGNLDVVSAPRPDFGEPFRATEMRLIEQQFDERTGRGRKVYEQIVLPLSEEATRLPPVTFSFFDPAGGRYHTLTRGPFDLRVNPPDTVSHVVRPGTLPTTGPPRIEGADILYLKPLPRAWPRPPGPARRVAGLVAGLLIPPWAAWLCWMAARRRERLRRDVALARRVRAPRAARDEIRAAEEAARRGDRKAVFEGVWRALSAYYGNRLNLPPGEVNAAAVTAALDASDAGRALSGPVRDWFEICDAERFGAGAGARFAGSAALHGAVADVAALLRSNERVAW